MIDAFITHLQGAGLTPSVEYAFTSNPIEDYTDDLPAILVYPSGHSGGEALIAINARQQLTESVTCLLGCAITDWRTLLDELRAAAIGWVEPGTTYDSLYLSSGDVLGVSGGFIWWTETYTTDTHLVQST